MKKGFGVFGVVVLVVTLLVVFCSYSLAQEQKRLVIKYAHTLPDMEPIAEQAKLFAKCVKEKSAGKIEIEVYPAAQLFTARDVFPAVRKGAVEMAAVVSGTMQGTIPLMEIFDLPFLFKDFMQVKKAWGGELGSTLKKELEKNGIKLLAEGYHSFIDVTNSKHEIKTPKDVSGLKMRTIGPMTADIVKIMGGGPVVLGGDEAFLAMERKVVDGSFQGFRSVAYRKIYEVQKYITLLRLNYTGVPMVINLAFWKSLPKDVQSLIEKCAEESEDFVLKATMKEEQDAIKTLKEKGMIIYNPTPAEMKEFSKATTPVKEAWIKKHGEVGAKLVQSVEKLQ
ncbi:MAG: TRAP transporter substrate-binding protein [Thermodesulfobacteriota bacterium]